MTRHHEQMRRRMLLSLSKEVEIPRAKGHLKGSRGDDLEHLLCPLLHIFRFNRLIVDEFSLLNVTTKSMVSSAHAAVTSLNADKKWFLSGTPAMTDFNDIKTMAKFLGVDLGVDDFTPGTILRSSRDKLLKELSGPEKFMCFQGQKSHKWHTERREVAQRFLDTFARQNDADLNSIQCVEGLSVIDLQGTQAALYQEMLQKLLIYDFRLDQVLTHDQPTNEEDVHMRNLTLSCTSGRRDFTETSR